jgi:cellulose biosynthesis protein BcsQ
MMHAKDKGKIITFYSYKGGTGRTMALANLAVIFSQKYSGSKNILMIDWDLDAPGLHQYFQSKVSVDKKDEFEVSLQEKPGLIELFTELKSNKGK